MGNTHDYNISTSNWQASRVSKTLSRVYKFELVCIYLHGHICDPFQENLPKCSKIENRLASPSSTSTPNFKLQDYLEVPDRAAQRQALFYPTNANNRNGRGLN